MSLTGRVVGEGFEPSKAMPTDLLCPFGHSGTHHRTAIHFTMLTTLPALTGMELAKDLNPQPADYKSAALPIELRQ